MKKILNVAVLLLLYSGSTACDVCGCGMGSMGMGYLPFQNRSMIGLEVDHQLYEITHPSFPGEIPSTSMNRFSRVELWYRQMTGERWFISARLPYKMNTIDDGEIQEISGFGDSRISAQFLLLNTESETKPRVINWIVGTGLKLPTGKFDDSDMSFFIPNMQLGTGSWDITYLSNFSYRLGKWGINQETSYLQTTPNGSNYKFGNVFEAGLLVFRQLRRNELMLVPQLGMRYVQQEQHFSNFKKKYVNEYSGMELLNMSLACDLYYQNWGFRYSMQHPTYHQVSKGYVSPMNRHNFQLIHFINLKEKNENN